MNLMTPGAKTAPKDSLLSPAFIDGSSSLTRIVTFASIKYRFFELG